MRFFVNDLYKAGGKKVASDWAAKFRVQGKRGFRHYYPDRSHEEVKKLSHHTNALLGEGAARRADQGALTSILSSDDPKPYELQINTDFDSPENPLSKHAAKIERKSDESEEDHHGRILHAHLREKHPEYVDPDHRPFRPGTHTAEMIRDYRKGSDEEAPSEEGANDGLPDFVSEYQDTVHHDYFDRALAHHKTGKARALAVSALKGKGKKSKVELPDVPEFDHEDYDSTHGEGPLMQMLSRGEWPHKKIVQGKSGKIQVPDISGKEGPNASKIREARDSLMAEMLPHVVSALSTYNKLSGKDEDLRDRPRSNIADIQKQLLQAGAIRGATTKKGKTIAHYAPGGHATIGTVGHNQLPDQFYEFLSHAMGSASTYKPSKEGGSFSKWIRTAMPRRLFEDDKKQALKSKEGSPPTVTGEDVDPENIRDLKATPDKFTDPSEVADVHSGINELKNLFRASSSNPQGFVPYLSTLHRAGVLKDASGLSDGLMIPPNPEDITPDDPTPDDEDRMRSVRSTRALENIGDLKGLPARSLAAKAKARKAAEARNMSPSEYYNLQRKNQRDLVDHGTERNGSLVPGLAHFIGGDPFHSRLDSIHYHHNEINKIDKTLDDVRNSPKLAEVLRKIEEDPQSSDNKLASDHGVNPGNVSHLKRLLRLREKTIASRNTEIEKHHKQIELAQKKAEKAGTDVDPTDYGDYQIPSARHQLRIGENILNAHSNIVRDRDQAHMLLKNAAARKKEHNEQEKKLREGLKGRGFKLSKKLSGSFKEDVSGPHDAVSLAAEADTARSAHAEIEKKHAEARNLVRNSRREIEKQENLSELDPKEIKSKIKDLNKERAKHSEILGMATQRMKELSKEEAAPHAKASEAAKRRIDDLGRQIELHKTRLADRKTAPKKLKTLRKVHEEYEAAHEVALQEADASREKLAEKHKELAEKHDHLNFAIDAHEKLHSAPERLNRISAEEDFAKKKLKDLGFKVDSGGKLSGDPEIYDLSKDHHEDIDPDPSHKIKLSDLDKGKLPARIAPFLSVAEAVHGSRFNRVSSGDASFKDRAKESRMRVSPPNKGKTLRKDEDGKMVQSDVPLDTEELERTHLHSPTSRLRDIGISRFHDHHGTSDRQNPFRSPTSLPPSQHPENAQWPPDAFLSEFSKFEEQDKIPPESTHVAKEDQPKVLMKEQPDEATGGRPEMLFSAKRSMSIKDAHLLRDHYNDTVLPRLAHNEHPGDSPSAKADRARYLYKHRLRDLKEAQEHHKTGLQHALTSSSLAAVPVARDAQVEHHKKNLNDLAALETRHGTRANDVHVSNQIESSIKKARERISESREHPRKKKATSRRIRSAINGVQQLRRLFGSGSSLPESERAKVAKTVYGSSTAQGAARVPQENDHLHPATLSPPSFHDVYHHRQTDPKVARHYEAAHALPHAQKAKEYVESLQAKRDTAAQKLRTDHGIDVSDAHGSDPVATGTNRRMISDLANYQKASLNHETHKTHYDTAISQIAHSNAKRDHALVAPSQLPPSEKVQQAETTAKTDAGEAHALLRQQADKAPPKLKEFTAGPSMFRKSEIKKSEYDDDWGDLEEDEGTGFELDPDADYEEHARDHHAAHNDADAQMLQEMLEAEKKSEEKEKRLLAPKPTEDDRQQYADAMSKHNKKTFGSAMRHAYDEETDTHHVGPYQIVRDEEDPSQADVYLGAHHETHPEHAMHLGRSSSDPKTLHENLEKIERHMLAHENPAFEKGNGPRLALSTKPKGPKSEPVPDLLTYNKAPIRGSETVLRSLLRGSAKMKGKQKLNPPHSLLQGIAGGSKSKESDPKKRYRWSLAPESVAKTAWTMHHVHHGNVPAVTARMRSDVKDHDKMNHADKAPLDTGIDNPEGFAIPHVDHEGNVSKASTYHVTSADLQSMMHVKGKRYQPMLSDDHLKPDKKPGKKPDKKKEPAPTVPADKGELGLPQKAKIEPKPIIRAPRGDEEAVPKGDEDTSAEAIARKHGFDPKKAKSKSSERADDAFERVRDLRVKPEDEAEKEEPSGEAEVGASTKAAEEEERQDREDFENTQQDPEDEDDQDADDSEDEDQDAEDSEDSDHPWVASGHEEPHKLSFAKFKQALSGEFGKKQQPKLQHLVDTFGDLANHHPEVQQQQEKVKALYKELLGHTGAMRESSSGEGKLAKIAKDNEAGQAKLKEYNEAHSQLGKMKMSAAHKSYVQQAVEQGNDHEVHGSSWKKHGIDKPPKSKRIPFHDPFWPKNMREAETDPGEPEFPEKRDPVPQIPAEDPKQEDPKPVVEPKQEGPKGGLPSAVAKHASVLPTRGSLVHSPDFAPLDAHDAQQVTTQHGMYHTTPAGDVPSLHYTPAGSNDAVEIPHTQHDSISSAANEHHKKMIGVRNPTPVVPKQEEPKPVVEKEEPAPEPVVEKEEPAPKPTGGGLWGKVKGMFKSDEPYYIDPRVEQLSRDEALLIKADNPGPDPSPFATPKYTNKRVSGSGNVKHEYRMEPSAGGVGPSPAMNEADPDKFAAHCHTTVGALAAIAKDAGSEDTFVSVLQNEKNIRRVLEKYDISDAYLKSIYRSLASQGDFREDSNV